MQIFHKTEQFLFQKDKLFIVNNCQLKRNVVSSNLIFLKGINE